MYPSGEGTAPPAKRRRHIIVVRSAARRHARCFSVGLGALFAIIFAAKFTRWHASVLMSDRFTT